MTADKEIKLLEEIRDLQRESLAEYRRVTQQSLDLQRQATTRQAQVAEVYRRALVGALVLIVPLLVLLFFLLVRFADRLFR